MAKIIKVGSQNPTFTSAKAKKASPIHTHRNSNEVTNPFKFTNFEGNTLQFADVFEGFKPQSSSKLRMIASSAAGTMNKIKSSIPESIVNFARKVRTGVSNAWDYAKNTNISDVPGIKQTKDFLLAERHLPSLGISLDGVKDAVYSRIEALSNSTVGKYNELVTRISLIGKSKYANMSVEDLRICLAEALAEGGINE